MDIHVVEAIVAGTISLAGTIYLIGRKVERVLARQEAHGIELEEQSRMARNSERMNCAHHGLIFDHLDISHEQRLEAEMRAGVESPGLKRA